MTEEQKELLENWTQQGELAEKCGLKPYYVSVGFMLATVEKLLEAARAEQRERDAEIAKEFHCDYRKCPQVIAQKILKSQQ